MSTSHVGHDLIHVTVPCTVHYLGVEEYLGNLHKEHENILSHMAFTSNFVDIKVSSFILLK